MTFHPELKKYVLQITMDCWGRAYDAVEYSTTGESRWYRFIIISFQSLYNALKPQKKALILIIFSSSECDILIKEMLGKSALGASEKVRLLA
jgi:hypothetical protein